MDAVGGAISRRRVRELLVDSQVVDRVAALMYGGEEGRLEVHPLVPCGDPDVAAGDPRGERMRRNLDPELLLRQLQHLDDALAAPLNCASSVPLRFERVPWGAASSC